ncbi:MAG TPA: hypothetical protein VF105_00025 [Gemmatimonadaceae bacterium]
MKHTHGEEALVLLLFAAAAACSDPASRAIAPTASSEIVASGSSGPQSEERVALTKIARLIAVAMDDEPARQQLKRDLRAAPFREHKLELGSYLRSSSGRTLLARMAASGGGDSAVFASLSAIRPLELYMPVAAHRETWTGKADVLVVSQLEESTPIVAFDEGGGEVALDIRTPPAQPTLSIVPIETRFDQPMDLNKSRNVRDKNGEAIGTLEPYELRPASLIACETCGGGGSGGGSTSIPPGIYLEFSRLIDAKEPWVRGDPEVEVHIQGPYMGSAPTYADDLSCSGERPYDSRKYFDQNGNFWSGRVLLFGEDEVVSFTQKFSNGFHVMFWEDDNQPCTLKLDTNALTSLLQSTAQATSTVAIKVLPQANWVLVAAAFLGSLFSNAGAWLTTNDDFLGVAVDQASAGYYYPDNTHVIMDGQTFNGRATIIYHH